MEQRISIERMEEAVNLFGSFDENIRLLETEFQVQVVNRGGEIVVSGEPENVMLAVKAVQALLTLSNKGETITDQHVRYVIGLVRSGQAERISELTQDVICITSKGRPVKPKTIGEDGTVLKTEFSREERDGWLYVTLQAECEEQIGMEVPLITE